jgi:hypothetical protein
MCTSNPFRKVLAALLLFGLQLGTATSHAQYFYGHFLSESAAVSWSSGGPMGESDSDARQASLSQSDAGLRALSIDLPLGNLASVSGGVSGNDKVMFTTAFKAVAPIENSRYWDSEARSEVAYLLDFTIAKSQQYAFTLVVDLDPAFFFQAEGTRLSGTPSSLFKLSGPGGIVFDRTADEDFTVSFTSFLSEGDYQLAGAGAFSMDGAMGPYGGSQQFSLVPVPEPSTYWLMLAGAAAIGAFVRRRRAEVRVERS